LYENKVNTATGRTLHAARNTAESRKLKAGIQPHTSRFTQMQVKGYREQFYHTFGYTGGYTLHAISQRQMLLNLRAAWSLKRAACILINIYGNRN